MPSLKGQLYFSSSQWLIPEDEAQGCRIFYSLSPTQGESKRDDAKTRITSPVY